MYCGTATSLSSRFAVRLPSQSRSSRSRRASAEAMLRRPPCSGAPSVRRLPIVAPTLLHYTSMTSRFRQCRRCAYLRSERHSHDGWPVTPLSPCTNLDAVYTCTAAKLSDEERSALLKFVTGRIRLPVSLKVEWSGGDSDLLPTSATCYQAIYMPLYVMLRFLPRSQRTSGRVFARKTRHPYDVQWWMT